LTENYRLTRLAPDSKLKPLDCGDATLNGFFLEDAKPHAEQLLAVTYLLENDLETIAYFSVLNDSIRQKDTSSNRLKTRVLKEMPPEKRGYKSFPAVKVGRFAVHKDYQGKGLGRLLMDYVKGYFLDNNKTGCRFIIVDAVKTRQALKFYEKNGFIPLVEETQPEDKTKLMYFDLICFRNRTAPSP